MSNTERAGAGRGGREMTYGLADLAAPFIQFKGTLGECYRQSKGFALCGIYRKEASGAWVKVASRYYSELTHESKIINVPYRGN